MKKNLKITALIVTFLLVFNIFAPTMKIVFAQAPANNQDYARLQINGATALENVSNAASVTATFDNGTVVYTGEGLYSDGNNTVYALGNVTITATPNENYSVTLWLDGNNLNSASTSFEGLTANEFKNMDAVFTENQQQQGGEQQQGGQGGEQQGEQNNNGNTVANIVVSAGDGTYTKSVYNPQTGTSEDQEFAYNDEIEFYINGTMWNHGATINYNSEDAATTVEFKFETLWINRYYEEIVINNVPYTVSNYLDFDDRTAWLVANNGEQTVSFTIPNVPKADTYNIVAKHGENNGTKYFATFLWTADPAQAGGHDYIGNSKLQFVKAEYQVGETTYTVTENDIEGNMYQEGQFNKFKSQDGFLSYGVLDGVDFDDGSLTLPGNAKVTMRVVPDYGYQVTSVNGGENFETTDAGVSEFTVVVPEGTAGYFQATVEQVDNTVEPTSNKVASGEIELGENAGTDIGNGTVRLTVEDIELSEDKIKDFDKKANEAGEYIITNFLDINLDKVLYRGSAENVWSEQIHHLTDKALITLKLEDGVDVSNIVIIHNIDNGEEFEIIPIESYDPETNTITFYTDSFSNFAIAEKSETANSPKTGDTIMIYVSIFIVAIVGYVLTTKYRKMFFKGKH